MTLPKFRGQVAAPAVQKPSLKKRPASKGLTNARCLTILKRLQSMGVVPKGDAQTLKRQAMKAAKSRHKTEQEKAASLLGRVLARIATALEADVRQAKAEADRVQNEHHARVAETSEAEIKFKMAKQAVVDGKAQLKEAEKAIVVETKAIADARAEKKSAADEIKVVDGKKKQLQHVEESVLQPLKEASLHGKEAQKQIRHLCKAGQSAGFHKELLSVIPAVLRKQLEKRHTFDNLVVKSLDTEFAKRAHGLCSKLQENELALQRKDEVLEERQAALASAKEACKQTSRKIVQSTSAVEASRKAVALAKKRVRSLPSVLKQAARKFERAQTRNNKFRNGPLAAYLKFQPVRNVAAEDALEEDMEENEEQEL